MVGNWRITFLHLFYFLSLVMIVSPNAIIHLVRFFVRCTLYTCAPSLTRTDFFCKVWKRAVMSPYATEYWLKYVPWWRVFFIILGGTPRFRSYFTDKVPIFADLSVSKTHFTDKLAFSDDLSVNFWPLCWGFTDRSRFLEHLSVKPGSKRLNFYGQPAIFAHFVRNRYFSDRPLVMPV